MIHEGQNYRLSVILPLFLVYKKSHHSYNQPLTERFFMSDGIKAMYDDHEDYELLCKKHNQPVLFNSAYSDYSLHEKWLIEHFEENSTTLSWEKYKLQHELDIKIRKFQKLESEKFHLLNEINDLKNKL